VEEVSGNTTSITMSPGDIARYSAPELVTANNIPPTSFSDTYSFAMLIVECITGEPPFSDLNDGAIIHARFTKGLSPPRPGGKYSGDGVSDDLWYIMARCWSVRPQDRPTMEEVCRSFS